MYPGTNFKCCNLEIKLEPDRFEIPFKMVRVRVWGLGFRFRARNQQAPWNPYIRRERPA